MVLFGQRPDEAIKAFLETSDWTLSTKVSPPPVIYDGHYLCTVSLRGHISKHINNAIQADITYIIMKPLEWIFLLVLYMFDEKPENRIATQYIGNKVVI